MAVGAPDYGFWPFRKGFWPVRKDFGLSDMDFGLFDMDPGLFDMDPGMLDKDFGMLDKDFGMFERDSGLSEKDSGLSDKDSGLQHRFLARFHYDCRYVHLPNGSLVLPEKCPNGSAVRVMPVDLAASGMVVDFAAACHGGCFRCRVRNGNPVTGLLSWDEVRKHGLPSKTSSDPALEWSK